MPQRKAVRRKVQPLKSSRETRSALHRENDFNAATKALEALNTAYRRVQRVLTAKIDRSDSGIVEISGLAGRLRWVSERQKLVRTALQAGPGMVAYVCGDCHEVQQLRSLAETAAKLANDSESFPTTLNLLSYIDHELGWTPPAQFVA